jgi:protein phosphatase 1 regulatory subunit 11
VVDNEGLGRKSSKVCCIYHKPREFGESSSEEDSSDSDVSSSDDDRDASQGRERGRGKGRNGHDHEHGEECVHGHSQGEGGGNGNTDGTAGRRTSPNAYEKMPRAKTRGNGGSVTEVIR